MNSNAIFKKSDVIPLFSQGVVIDFFEEKFYLAVVPRDSFTWYGL